MPVSAAPMYGPLPQSTPATAPPKRAAGRKSTGFRRLSPATLQTERSLEGFGGLPKGVTQGQVLAAFKGAAPRLGLSPREVHVIDWLFKYSQPQDWAPGSRPIVWPSADTQEKELDLSPSQARALNREAIDAGLIVMRDSPNGKRWGKRDGGSITEAYGFDLSPLAMRYPEFVQLSEEARKEREELRLLRRRTTIASRRITQLLETAAEWGLEDEGCLTLRREAKHLAEAVRHAERPDAAAIDVAGLERRRGTLYEFVQNGLAAPASPLKTDDGSLQKALVESVETAGLGAENRCHQYSYKPPADPEQDAVVAQQGGKAGMLSAAAPEGRREPQELPGEAAERRERDVQTNSQVDLGISAEEVVRLAPRLRAYLKSPRPAWPDIVDAADGLRGEMGVSKSLWGDACLAMGREPAAIAVAIVSAKSSDHFRTTPGGYFHGMVVKAKAGELNLGRTIWGLRKARAAPDAARLKATEKAIEARVASAETWLSDHLLRGAQWAQIRADLRIATGSDYRTWLREMTFVGIDDGVVTVNLPTQLLRDRVNSDYRSGLLALWRAKDPDIVDVECCVG